tara:strand:+ start:11493 stop:12011 length:519 start_codon:yes stop_codon:yes gene_type:complete
LGRVQVGSDMGLCPKVFKISVTVEQDPDENILLSVLVNIVRHRFGSQIIEQEGSLGIVVYDIVLVLFCIVLVHHFLGTDGREPKWSKTILSRHVLDDLKTRCLSGAVGTEDHQSLPQGDIFQKFECRVPVPVPAEMPEEIFVGPVHFKIEIHAGIKFLCRPIKNFFKKLWGA